MIQSSRCDQVLTGVLPYRGSDVQNMVTRIRASERPFRPIYPSGNRWLPDPVWDIITTSWHDQPNQRCELPVIHDVLSSSSQQEVQHVKLGHLNLQNDGNPMVAETFQTPKWQPGKLLSLTTSFFQVPQNPESEIQRQVDEMNEVRFSTPLPPRLTRCAAS